jgi:hypothetical protein
MDINDGWFGDARVNQFTVLTGGNIYSSMGFLVYLWRGCILKKRYSFQPRELEVMMNVGPDVIQLLKKAGLLVPGKEGRLVVMGAEDFLD